MHTAASFATALFHNFCHLSNFYTFARFFVLRHFHNSSTDFSAKSARNTFVFSVSKQITHNPCALLSKTGFFSSIFRGCYNHFCFKGDQAPLKSSILRFKESTAASHNPCALLSKTGFFSSIFRGCYNHFCFKGDQAPLKSSILRFKESTAASISCRVVSFPSVMRTVPAAYSFGTPSASIT